MNTNSL